MEESQETTTTTRTYEVVTRSNAVATTKKRPSQPPAESKSSGEVKPGLLSMPYEILVEILGRLGPRDLQSIRQVSSYFETVARDPIFWKEYEVSNNDTSTADVIEDLKRMPLLKKICINSRVDCDDILRQISLTNKNLEKLYITNCTGSTPKLYLRPGYLTRILERCRRLHTFCVFGTRVRGLKLYRLLGEAGPRLRFLSVTTTRAQFATFVHHVNHIAKKDRDLINLMSGAVPKNKWGPMQYVIRGRKTIVISYQTSSPTKITRWLCGASSVE